MLTKEETALIRDRIVDQMFDAVCAFSPEGEILTANPAMERLLMVAPGGLSGKNLKEALGKNEEFKNMVLEAIQGKAADALVTFDPPRGGQRKHLRVAAIPLAGDAKAGAAVAVRDVSELVSLQSMRSAFENLREAFGRYIPVPVLKELLDTPNGLAMGGRRQELTILMSDLRGFTSLGESLPPEGLIELLNHYLGEMTEAIEGKGGTIIEFIGDGILAVFGAPVGRRNHARDAVAAAIEMQRRMVGINDWNKKYHFPALEMGIGVHTGQAILGNIGSEKRTKYGVVGMAVNLTGRLESYTIGGEVLISDATLRQVHATLQVVRRMQILPKGSRTPLVAYVVSGIGEPYDISYQLPEEGMVPLKTPLIVRFRLIEGKMRGKEVYLGVVRARSQRELLLSSQEALEDYEDISLEIPGELTYSGKILGRRPGGYLVHLTSS